MSDQKRLDLIIEAVHLYYEQGFNQTEISKQLDCSISTVSRLLKEAQEVGVVEIVIKYPYAVIPSLGNELKEKYNLKNAYVIPTSGVTYFDLVQNLGTAAAMVLDRYLADDMSLGISLGLSVAATIRAYKSAKKTGCKVFRLQGAAEFEIMEGTNLSRILASKINGEAILIPSPWLLPSVEVRDMLVREQSVEHALAAAKDVNLGLVGMGTMDPAHSTILRNKLISVRELNEFRSYGAVGEIFGLHYDIDGRVIDIEFNKRLVAIDLKHLAAIDTVIGVAAGIHKVEPLLGAINGGLINVVVTDSDAARELLSR